MAKQSLLMLKTATPDDINSIAAWVNSDPVGMQTMPDYATAPNWLTAMVGQTRQVIVAVHDDEEVGFADLDYDESEDVVCFAYFVRPEYRRQGLSGRFLEELAKYCWQTFPAGRMAGEVETRNQTSAHALERAGFRPVANGDEFTTYERRFHVKDRLRWFDGKQWTGRISPTTKDSLRASRPYALATAFGAIAFIGLVLINSFSSGWDWLGLLLLLMVLWQLILLLVGLVLGLRRGYDWFTLVVCAIVYLLLIAITFGMIMLFNLDLFNPDLFDWRLFSILSGLVESLFSFGGFSIIYFIIPTQIGMLPGTLIRRFRLRHPAKPPAHFADE